MAEGPNRKRDHDGEFVFERNQKEPEKEEEKTYPIGSYLDDFYYVDDNKTSTNQALKQVTKLLDRAIQENKQVNDSSNLEKRGKSTNLTFATAAHIKTITRHVIYKSNNITAALNMKTDEWQTLKVMIKRMLKRQKLLSSICERKYHSPKYALWKMPIPDFESSGTLWENWITTMETIRQGQNRHRDIPMNLEEESKKETDEADEMDLD